MSTNDPKGKDDVSVARGTIFLTPEEKRALRIVAADRGSSESDVLRAMTIAAVVAEFTAKFDAAA